MPETKEEGGGSLYPPNPLKRLYNYLQLYFTGMSREFNFTKGSRVRFGQLNIPSKARDVKLAKTDEGTRGEVKFLDIREK